MNIASLIAASRLVAQERAIAVTGVNLANANTPGFQASRVQFSDWLNPQPGARALPGERRIAYTQDRATWREPRRGAISQTGNPFDLALQNDGYFTVATAAGPRLTRDGRFGPLPDGTIGDSAGNTLLDTNGAPLRLAPTDTHVTIAGDGTVSSENGRIGKIGVVQPDDPMQLTAEGATLFRSGTPTSPVPLPGITQGAKEGSNVQPVLELTRMMNDLREFQFTTQLIQAEDDRIQAAIDKILPRQG